MDNSPPLQSTLETLRTVEFRLGLKGYNVDEVDEYLEKAAVEAETFQEQLRQANERVRKANERITQLEAELDQNTPKGEAAAEPAESLHRTLALAERVLDQIKQESEAEAAEILQKAQADAKALVDNAEEQSRTRQHESQQQLRDEVTRLEGMRAQLANDVENMARHLETERNRLHGTLGDMLKWVEENIQPTNSLMAVKSGSSASGLSGASSDDDDDDSGEVAQVLDLHASSPSIASTAQPEHG